MRSTFIPNVGEIQPSRSRLHRLFSSTLLRVPKETLPLSSLVSLEFRAKSRAKGRVGLTTFGFVDYRTGKRTESGTQKITLYTDLLSKLSDKAVTAVIAHELAHAWLNEHKKPEQSKRREVEADELAVKWGFGAEVHSLLLETDQG